MNFPDDLSGVALTVGYRPWPNDNPQAQQQAFLCCTGTSTGIEFGVNTVQLTQQYDSSTIACGAINEHPNLWREEWIHANSSCSGSNCTFGGEIWPIPAPGAVSCPASGYGPSVLYDLYQRKSARTVRA
jgi:hypothetical protein